MLSVESLTKVFDTAEGPVTAVKDVSLEVSAGEFFSLLGPSGCGKTTTLRMIAGLETTTSGTIRFGGRDLARLPPAQRNLGMVFQSYALFPHLTVLENAAYGLRVRGQSNERIRSRVLELLDVLGLAGLHGRYPSDLSGGQQQRVSIARALAYEPDMFLLDEPLANLDAKLRVQMRTEISRLHRQLRATMVYVTHDQVEAMTMGDRIVVLREGEIQQVDTPLALYDRPANRFVAGFIGSPAMNFAEGRISDDGLHFVADGGADGPAFTLPLEAEDVALLQDHAGRAVTLGCGSSSSSIRRSSAGPSCPS